MKSGREQFTAWMKARWPSSRRKQREAAKHFGWDYTYISKLVRGRRAPGLTNALTIERKTGIPVEAWASKMVDKSLLAVRSKPRQSQLAQGVNGR